VATALPFCVFVATGCTVVLSPDEAQCEAAADCASRGFGEGAMCVEGVCTDGGGAGGADPIWGCLGNVVEPTPDTSKTFTINVRLAFASGGEPVTSADVDICDKLDVNCMGTSPDFPKDLTPDAQGMVTATLKQGFDGFFRITDPEIVDSRVYVGRPIVEQPNVKEVQLLRPFEYETLANLAQSAVDPTRGSVIVLGIDCTGDGGAGMRFETNNGDGATVPFYLINQAPTIPPTATATDGDGFGGFFNMPLSNAVVRAYLAEDGTYVGESSLTVLANTISYVQITPAPQ